MGTDKQEDFWTAAPAEVIQEIAPVPPAANGEPPEEWLGGVHPDGKLELTRSYPLQADKLNRVLTYLGYERATTGSMYHQSAEGTGMPEAQAKALIHYGTEMELLTPRSLRVKPLGKLLLESDPFGDKLGTLWLLHYLLASNPKLVVWNYTCNAIFPAVTHISKDEAAAQFLPFSGRWSESSIRKKVRKELRALFDSYTTDMFAALDYLRVGENGGFAVNQNVVPVPPLILLATIMIYRDRHHPGATGVEIPTLTYAAHAPGRLMRQGELYVRQALDELHEAGRVTIESKANLDQVRFPSGATWFAAVQEYLTQ